MTRSSNQQLAELWEDHEPPCLSLYQPTHRHLPDNQQDLIRFRNLLKELEVSLLRQYEPREVQALLEPCHRLGEQPDFWNHTLDALAVFRAAGFFRVWRLQEPVPELAIAARSFHTKPLLRSLFATGRFQVLCLSLKRIRLFEGNRDVLDEVDLVDEVPRTIEEALGEELTEPHLTVGSYTMGPAGPNPNARHGHGGRRDEMDVDKERFFRVVDRAILEHYSKPSGLPLILTALAEHQGHFRALSRNTFLLERRLEVNPEALSSAELRAGVWKIVEPEYRSYLDGIIEQFGTGRSRGLGMEDLALIGKAAIEGRVGTLLLDGDCHIPGHIDRKTGQVAPGDLSHPEIDDLLDDLGELVLQKGGQVLVVSQDRMPASSGAAAILRF